MKIPTIKRKTRHALRLKLLMAAVFAVFISLLSGTFGSSAMALNTTAPTASSNQDVSDDDPADTSTSKVQDDQATPAPTTNDTDDEVVRTENVSETVFGASSFEEDGKASASATVKTKSGVKIMLNISVKPMPASQVTNCWTVPVGTVVDMEGIWNGVPSVKTNYVVQPGDNTFCHKKGGGKQVYKKSCGNRAWGVPGGPKRPPRSLPRVHGKVMFADYYMWKVNHRVKETASGKANASVTITYNGETKCAAAAGVTGHASAFSATAVRVRARSFGQAMAAGAREIDIKLRSWHQVSITARNRVEVDIDGQVAAYCQWSPPENPEEPEQPDVTGSISCPSLPHLRVNDDGYMVCKVTRDDGVKPSISQVTFTEVNDLAHFSNVVETPYKEAAEINPCPADTLCVRVHVWAHNTVGYFKYIAKFTLFGAVYESPGTIEIAEDEF